MSKVHYNYSSYTPVEAIIRAYENEDSVQTIVNAILDAGIPGYNYNNVCALMLNYKKLLDEDRFSQPADIELEDYDFDDSEAVRDETKVRYNYSCYTPVEAIIRGYENGESPNSVLQILKDAGVKLFTLLRVKYIMKLYKKFNDEGTSYNNTDLEIISALAESSLKETKKTRAAESRRDETSRDKIGNKKMKAKDVCKSKQGRENDSRSLSAEPKFYEPKKLSSTQEKDLQNDPSPEFKKMKANTMTVAKGIMPALIISGNGGIGKTYSVCKTLDAYGPKGSFYEVLKVKSTTLALYEHLWENRNKICVLDDCDSVFNSADGISLLKCALDSGEVREITWNSKANNLVKTSQCRNNAEVAAAVEKWNEKHDSTMGIPSKFFFEGAIIFITNKKKSELKEKDEALLTRCTVTEINLNEQQVLKRLGQILDKMKITGNNGRDITDKSMKKRVFDWISSEEFLKDPRRKGRGISFRLFINTYKQCYAGNEDWKELSFDNQ